MPIEKVHYVEIHYICLSLEERKKLQIFCGRIVFGRICQSRTLFCIET